MLFYPAGGWMVFSIFPVQKEFFMSKSVELVKAVVFVLAAAAFFIVPWCCPAARFYAPGLAVITGILFSVTVGNPLQK